MMRVLFPVFAALVGTKFDLFPIGRELVVVGMVIGLQSLCFMMEMALLTRSLLKIQLVMIGGASVNIKLLDVFCPHVIEMLFSVTFYP